MWVSRLSRSGPIRDGLRHADGLARRRKFVEYTMNQKRGRLGTPLSGSSHLEALHPRRSNTNCESDKRIPQPRQSYRLDTPLPPDRALIISSL
ncbi:unnamed protein product [Leptosia nina]|uniref:Uncharacterized protein n=1 Tax=Leptosia nina TaxID=320188 RepID=A0AAV1IW34_9NEOP